MVRIGVRVSVSIRLKVNLKNSLKVRVRASDSTLATENGSMAFTGFCIVPRQLQMT